jgi:carboxyl-terminal processing protease
VTFLNTLKTFALLLILNLTLLSPAWAANEKTTPSAANDRTESAIAKTVSRTLEKWHYSQVSLDDQLSYKFLQRYLDALDPMRMHLFQSDVNEFLVYSNRLDDMTAKEGDVSPADLIFERVKQHVIQHADYVAELLKNEKFDFAGQDRYLFDRRKLARPADLEEAKKLWRQQLRYEYLQEKLSSLLRSKRSKSSPRNLPKRKLN